MAKISRNQRQLLWNTIPENTGDPSVLHYFFVIANQPREIEIITRRIREELHPTDNERIITKGKIENSGGLYYRCLTIDSFKRTTIGGVNLKRIYDGLTKRDEKLGTHRKQDGLASYIDNKFSEKI